MILKKLLRKNNKGFSIIEVSTSAAITLSICFMLISVILNSVLLIRKGNEKINTSIYSSSIIEYYLGSGIDYLLLQHNVEEKYILFFFFNNFTELKDSLTNSKDHIINLSDDLESLKLEGSRRNKQYAGFVKFERDKGFELCSLYKITSEIFNLNVGKLSKSSTTSYIRR